jgi:hypothetical protein
MAALMSCLEERDPQGCLMHMVDNASSTMLVSVFCARNDLAAT